MIRDVVFLLLFPSPLHPLLSTNKMHFFRLSHESPSPSEGEIDGFVIAWTSELENILQLGEDEMGDLHVVMRLR